MHKFENSLLYFILQVVKDCTKFAHSVEGGKHTIDRRHQMQEKTQNLPARTIVD